MKKILLIAFCILFAIGAFGFAQRRGADKSLSEPFRGVVAGGKLEKDLFSIESTGVSTGPVKEAADALLAALDDQQKSRTQFPVDDAEWRKWANQHAYKRQGVSFKEMTEPQRELAFGLMQASLSAKGLQLSQDIMKLNGTLAELANDYQEYGEWLYWITIMGEPSETEPWGWQVDGHHLVINYFVLGDQVVMSPVFMGSEPIMAEAGKFKGIIILQDEQDNGLALAQTLTPTQRPKAILSLQKPGTNNVGEAFKDNLNLDYAGIAASELDEDQRTKLLEVIGQYVGNMDDGHAKIKMSEVEKHLDRTYFAWIGDTQEGSVFYYRIHSPVILIEFDHQRRVAPRSERGKEAKREHIHTVVRTPNGNDYGKDLLRQHYEEGSHSHD